MAEEVKNVHKVTLELITNDKKESSMTGIDLKIKMNTNLVKVIANERRQNFTTVATLRKAPILQTGTGSGPNIARIASIPPATT